MNLCFLTRSLTLAIDLYMHFWFLYSKSFGAKELINVLNPVIRAQVTEQQFYKFCMQNQRINSEEKQDK